MLHKLISYLHPTGNVNSSVCSAVSFNFNMCVDDFYNATKTTSGEDVIECTREGRRWRLQSPPNRNWRGAGVKARRADGSERLAYVAAGGETSSSSSDCPAVRVFFIDY